MRMNKRDAVMFALYLVVIGMGAILAERDKLFGIGQIVIGSTFFGWRLHHLSR
jgi:hypothetical protein